MSDYPIKEFGAIGNGEHKNTTAIQQAIDTCSRGGGGRIVFPSGIYKSGTLFLKSNVDLHLEAGAVLLGSADISDYSVDTFKQMYRGESHMDRCLIFAQDCENLAISGKGEINGQGELFPPKNSPVTERPMLFRYLNCTKIRISGVTMRNPASWTNAFIGCRDIHVDGIRIHSRANWNGDGLDFDRCQDVFVSNCLLDCSDDCICLQSSRQGEKCRNIVITNTILRSKWAGIRIGLLSSGDIENVTVSNCIFEDIECSGLKIQATEGGTIRNMVFSNLIMENVQRPFFITLNHYREGLDEPDEVPETSRVQNLQFANIRARGRPSSPIYLRSCMIIDSVPGHVIEDIMISDFHYSAVGRGSLEDAQRVRIPFHLGKRAECFNYEGSLPALGLYARHVRGLTLQNVNIDGMEADERPAIFLDDCEKVEKRNFYGDIHSPNPH